MSAPSDEFKPSDTVASETGGSGPTATQNDYVSRTGQSEIKVQGDDAAVQGGYDDPAKADSDAQLQQDEQDAISQDNIIGSRTRGAGKPSGTYQEPGDEEGLGGNDGRSRVAGGPA